MKKVPDFQNRWLITGTIRTMSEFHAGDGGAGSLHDRRRPADKEKEESDASTVCVDYRGTAYLPGSGLKGTLRALVQPSIDEEAHAIREWWRQNQRIPKEQRSSRPSAPWSDLLGAGKPEEGGAVGGKLEFWDAFHAGGEGVLEEQPDPAHLHLDPDLGRPWWDHRRKTCVAVSVSLDRRTKSARENLLYHTEYVPAGERFAFEIGGDNLAPEDISRLLALLDALHRGHATLGAGASHGWGRVECTVDEIRRLDLASLQHWKQNPVAAKDACQPVDAGTRAYIETFREGADLVSAARELEIAITLRMESPWLVRDPRQRERSEAARQRELSENDKPSDAAPIRDEAELAFLPAKSLRGALRARAEKILRTLGRAVARHPEEEVVLSKRRTPAEILGELRSRDLAVRLFGLGGWQGPLDVSRFVAHTAEDFLQEFVAIDRFTGSAAEGAKFDAKLAGMTLLAGRLAVDLGRLREVDPDGASLGLLALVLRDLAEGDIPIGSGSSKGQGYCTAAVTWNGKDLFAPDCEAARFVDAFQQTPLNPPPAVP